MNERKALETSLQKKISKENQFYSNPLERNVNLDNKLIEEESKALEASLQENKALEASLKEKIVKEKQKYSNLLGKYEELQESKALEAALLEKLVIEKQKYSDLLRKYEELQNPLSLGNEVEAELKKLQLTMENVTVSLGKVEVIKKY